MRPRQWQFSKELDAEFLTQCRGAVQQLPNGNVLIPESQDGRVLEVEPQGQIVWEFLNPGIDTELQQRALIYRIEHIEAGIVEPLLAASLL